MKTRQYRKIEKAVAAHDGGGIWERWRYGRLLLVEDEKTTPNGNLRDKVIDGLISASALDGITLSRREIQYRLQAGKAYPTEDQLRNAVAQYETWHDLVLARFPEFPAPEGARPYDPRDTDELVSQSDSRGARLLEHTVQGSLFPRGDDTLAEAKRWMAEQDELTARFVGRGIRRHEEFDALVKAVNGDLTKTVGHARALLEAES